jgi:hypothetical protein
MLDETKVLQQMTRVLALKVHRRPHHPLLLCAQRHHDRVYAAQRDIHQDQEQRLVSSYESNVYDNNRMLYARTFCVPNIWYWHLLF